MLMTGPPWTLSARAPLNTGSTSAASPPITRQSGKSGSNNLARMIPPEYCHSCNGEGVWDHAMPGANAQGIKIKRPILRWMVFAPRAHRRAGLWLPINDSTMLLWFNEPVGIVEFRHESDVAILGRLPQHHAHALIPEFRRALARAVKGDGAMRTRASRVPAFCWHDCCP